MVTKQKTSLYTILKSPKREFRQKREFLIEILKGKTFETGRQKEPFQQLQPPTENTQKAVRNRLNEYGR